MRKLDSSLVVLLIASLAGNAYLGYYLYGNGIETDYESGFAYGYEAGYENGTLAGYDLGYSNGNSSGYQLGYEEGYNFGYLLGFYDGNETGFDDGYVKGVEDGAGRGYTIRDPTFQEALDFIALDQTDKNPYDKETYNCYNFVADVKNNAFQAGYRAGNVGIDFPDGAHAIVAFNTTDYGLIFIEPQWDDIVSVTIGQSYSYINGYEIPDYDDTIVRFIIIW